MKKNLLYLVLGLSFSIAHSQEVRDAMRYAQSELNGTARFTAMSGAFGALGGDISATNVNPAGSAIIENNQFAFTLGNYSTKNNSNYFGTSTSASDNSFDINQAGGVFVFKTRNPSSDWKKLSLGVNYANTNNYDNALFSAGTNKTQSVANYFLNYANGVPLNVLEDSKYAVLGNGAQQAFLGYQGYVINPVTNNPQNTLYTSNVRAGGDYYQENSLYSSGYNGKLSFNMATSYKDKFYFGFNLNSHFTDYAQDTKFYESNTNPLNADDRVQNLNFSNNLHTYGSGFSFQLGTIAKITDKIRLGLAYESPTWYQLYDELSQKLVTVSSNSVDGPVTNVVDPSVINYYDPYNLQTPGSFTGSFAYVFGKVGLISLDYKYKDYSNTSFSPSNDSYLTGLNTAINNTLGSSNEIRVGAEYKVKALSLRGGYRFEDSPYKNSTTIGDLNSFSGGLGYNFGAIKLDFAYVYAHNTAQQRFFSQGFTDSARIKSYKNNVSMTLLFEM